MRLFLYLVLGHLVGDFILQSSELVRLKRSTSYGLYPHVLLVLAATGVAIAGSTRLWWLVLAFVAAVHLLVDRLSILASARSNVGQIYIFTADQVVHVTALAGIAAAFARFAGQPAAPSWVLPSSLWVLALLDGAFGVSFAGSIFLFEMGESAAPADSNGGEGALLNYSLERVIGLAERTALYFAAVFGVWWVVVVALAARAVWVWTRPLASRKKAIAETAATVLVVAVAAALTIVARRYLMGV